MIFQKNKKRSYDILAVFGGSKIGHFYRRPLPTMSGENHIKDYKQSD
jgi:hypothetical protein